MSVYNMQFRNIGTRRAIPRSVGQLRYLIYVPAPLKCCDLTGQVEFWL